MSTNLRIYNPYPSQNLQLGPRPAQNLYLDAPEPAAPAWVPSDLGPTKNKIWLPATSTANFTESGGVVESWLDSSGNNNDYSQASASLRPTYDEVKKGVVFNGTSHKLQHSTGVTFDNGASAVWDLYVVLDFQDVSNDNKLQLLGATDNNSHIWLRKSVDTITVWRNKFLAASFTATWVNDQKYLLHVQNNALTFTASIAGQSDTDTGDTSYPFVFAVLGNYSASTRYFGGTIYEIVYCEGLVTADRDQLLTYFSDNHGV